MDVLIIIGFTVSLYAFIVAQRALKEAEHIWRAIADDLERIEKIENKKG